MVHWLHNNHGCWRPCLFNSLADSTLCCWSIRSKATRRVFIWLLLHNSFTESIHWDAKFKTSCGLPKAWSVRIFPLFGTGNTGRVPWLPATSQGLSWLCTGWGRCMLGGAFCAHPNTQGANVCTACAFTCGPAAQLVCRQWRLQKPAAPALQPLVFPTGDRVYCTPWMVDTPIDCLLGSCSGHARLTATCPPIYADPGGALC